jgi:hypothetical protein
MIRNRDCDREQLGWIADAGLSGTKASQYLAGYRVMLDRIGMVQETAQFPLDEVCVHSVCSELDDAGSILRGPLERSQLVQRPLDGASGATQ